jgi:hypothetical protein
MTSPSRCISAGDKPDNTGRDRAVFYELGAGYEDEFVFGCENPAAFFQDRVFNDCLNDKPDVGPTQLGLSKKYHPGQSYVLSGGKVRILLFL